MTLVQLQALSDIDWASLTDAYGQAVNVPDFLRKAASEDDDQRTAALDGLFSHVWHQGTVYEVTAVAVPFIAAIAAGIGKDRGDLFELLRLIRTGQADSLQHAEYETEETLASDAWLTRTARERGWVAASHAAVDSCLPLAKATALNDAEDEFVRWQAAWLWWVLGPPSTDELLTLARNAPPLVVTGMVLLGAEIPSYVASQSAAMPWSSLPAISALIVELRTGLDADRVRRVLAMLSQTGPVHPYWHRLPGAHPRGPAMNLLLPVIQSGQAYASIVIPELIRILPALPEGAAQVAASAGIFLVWGAGATAAVSEVQAMLAAVAASEGVWVTSQKDMLSSYSLPRSRDGMARLAAAPANDVSELRALAETF